MLPNGPGYNFGGILSKGERVVSVVLGRSLCGPFLFYLAFRFVLFPSLQFSLFLGHWVIGVVTACYQLKPSFFSQATWPVNYNHFLWVKILNDLSTKTQAFGLRVNLSKRLKLSCYMSVTVSHKPLVTARGFLQPRAGRCLHKVAKALWKSCKKSWDVFVLS